jgi:hypothetical protein
MSSKVKSVAKPKPASKSVKSPFVKPAAKKSAPKKVATKESASVKKQIEPIKVESFEQYKEIKAAAKRYRAIPFITNIDLLKSILSFDDNSFVKARTARLIKRLEKAEAKAAKLASKTGVVDLATPVSIPKDASPKVKKVLKHKASQEDALAALPDTDKPEAITGVPEIKE